MDAAETGWGKLAAHATSGGIECTAQKSYTASEWSSRVGWLSAPHGLADLTGASKPPGTIHCDGAEPNGSVRDTVRLQTTVKRDMALLRRRHHIGPSVCACMACCGE